MVDCNCPKCVGGEQDVFMQVGCLVEQSELELKRLKLDMHNSGIGVLLLASVIASFVFLASFSALYLIHRLS